MAIDFPRSTYTAAEGVSAEGWPASPSNGDTQTNGAGDNFTFNGTSSLWVLDTGRTLTLSGGTTYSWDGEKWIAQSHIPFRYFGPQSTDPTGLTADNEGDLYFNTVENEMRVYNGSSWDVITYTPTDGSVTNVHVNASAAIAGSKIDPDFGSQTIETTGVFSAAGGAQATPSITFTGDLNTGIYSPGADQVAVATGGQGRLFVDASGNVGVGQAPKTWNLLGSGRSIQFPTASIANFDNYGSGNYQLQLLLNAYRDGSGTYRYLKSSGVASHYTQNNSGNHLWYTAPSGTADGAITFSERLRITSDGKVGIGTSSPSQKLTTAGNIKIAGEQASNVSNLIFTRTDRSWSINNETDLRFYTGGGDTDSPATATVVFTGGGSVGIGTTSPSGTLTVTDGTDGLEIGREGELGATRLFAYNRTSASEIDLISRAANHRFQTNGTERIRIDSSGRLLVGTTSGHTVGGTLGNAQFSGAGTQVHFVSTSTAPSYINFAVGSSGTNVNNGTALGRIKFFGYHTNGYDTGAQIEAAVDGTPGDGDLPTRLTFSTTADGASSPTERMRIDNEGKTTIKGKGSSNNPFEIFTLQNTETSSSAQSIQINLETNRNSQQAFSRIKSIATDNSGTSVLQLNSSEYRFKNQADTSTFATIDSSGRLLVGTTTARSLDSGTQLLQVEAADGSATGRIAIGTNNNDNPAGAGIYLFRSRAGSLNGNTIVNNGDDLGSIYFHGADGTDLDSRAAQIRCEVDGTPGTNDMPGRLVFSTTANTASSPTERMRIDSSGRVGIGTTSPSSVLHVVNSTAVIKITDSDTTGDVWLQNSGGDAVFRTIEEKPIRFFTNNSEKARIDSSGNVGIGTTSPNQLLHLASASNAIINIQNSAGTAGSIINFTGTSAGTAEGQIKYDHTDDYMRFYVNRSEAARIDSSGRLLVGTSSEIVTNSPSIQCVDTGTSVLALGRNDGTISTDDGIGIVEFLGNGGGGAYERVGNIRCVADGNHATGDKPGRLEFSTTADGASSPTERMRISSNGTHSFYTSGEYTTTRTSNSTTSGSLAFGVFAGATNVTDGTLTCNIKANGNILNQNNSYGSISDVKLKENIVEARSQWNDLKALRVCNYNLKEGQTHTQIGLIAQEVELVSPGLVSESPDLDEEGNDLGTVTKSVNYSVLYMKAVKALQEAMERIETLEAEVSALKSN